MLLDLDPLLADDADTLDWHVWQQRLAVSPGAAAEWARMAM
jgi:hypothetical protein